MPPIYSPDGPQPWPEDHTAQGPSYEAELEAAMRVQSSEFRVYLSKDKNRQTGP